MQCLIHLNTCSILSPSPPAAPKRGFVPGISAPVLITDYRGSQCVIGSTPVWFLDICGKAPLYPSSPILTSLSLPRSLSMNTNATRGPTSSPHSSFFAGLGGRGETEQFQLSILPHEAGSARLAAAPVSFLFFFF